MAAVSEQTDLPGALAVAVRAAPAEAVVAVLVRADSLGPMVLADFPERGALAVSQVKRERTEAKLLRRSFLRQCS
jgi:hypothetical protein